MSGRIAQVLAGTGVGFGSANMLRDGDLGGDGMMSGAFQWLTGRSNARSVNTLSASNQQLDPAITALGRQVEALSQSQRSSHEIIVSSNQPSAVFGVPVWQVVGLVGTAGTIYMKVNGYEARDLVYVSKKHFDTVANALREQYDVLETSIETAKTELLEKIGLVEDKVDEAKESIEETIATEVGKVDSRVEEVSTELKLVGESVQFNRVQVEAIANDLNTVRSDLSTTREDIDGRFNRVDAKVEGVDTKVDGVNAQVKDVDTKVDGVDAKVDGVDAKVDGVNAQVKDVDAQVKGVDAKVDGVDAKIEEVSVGINSQLESLRKDIDKQSKGISLLCEFVCDTKSQTPSSPNLLSDLEEYAKAGRSVTPSGRTTSVPALHRKRQSAGLSNVRSPPLSIAGSC